MLQVIFDSVAQPGNGCSECLLCFLHVQQSFFERERRNEWTAAAFRVSQRFIDEEYLHAFGTEVPVYRLQTWDVSDERWSG